MSASDRRLVVQLLEMLADRLDARARQISGDGDLDVTAPDRAEIIAIVAAEVRAVATAIHR